MIKHLINFFQKQRLDPYKPVLLAFSGGPDSLALFHLLNEYARLMHLRFALAHVDHGWRSESKNEAQAITLMAQKWGILLHIKELDPKAMKGNLEAACRSERLTFFSLLCQQYGYQAVLFGHHADDLAETVLKRMFEGASLPLLSSLEPEVIFQGMKLWRPLLNITKKEILSWLANRNLQGFEDVTNTDTRFLRARFRQKTIPYLSKEFGKEIAPGLCQIAREASELKEFLDQRFAIFLKGKIEGPWGVMCDFNGSDELSTFEIKYLIKRLCHEQGLSASRDSIEKMRECLRENGANKWFNICKDDDNIHAVYIDHKRLFIINRFFPPLPQIVIPIKIGHTIQLGNWEVTAKIQPESYTFTSDWKHIWKEGWGETTLPLGEYTLTYPPSSLLKNGELVRFPPIFDKKFQF